jgi:hypothetical protein
LFVQFRRSERGSWVFFGFLASCLVMLAASYIVAVVPNWHSSEAHFGLPVKNPIILSQHFVFCSFALLGIAMGVFAQNRYAFTGAILLVVLAFMASVLFVQVSRTALIYIPVLVLVFALRYFRWRGVAIVIAGALTIGVIVWNSSSYLRDRAMQAVTELQRHDEKAILSIHLRLEWYRRSLNFWAEKPVFGHGTGAIRGLFDKAVVGETGARAISTANPHNQTLAVAVPLGLIGVAILWAMWLTHWLCFARNSGIAAWIGLVVVTQNIVSSLFNSNIFDFFEGWLYVLGVGVAGGVMRRMAAPGMSESTPAMPSRNVAGGASPETIAAG